MVLHLFHSLFSRQQANYEDTGWSSMCALENNLQQLESDIAGQFGDDSGSGSDDFDDVGPELDDISICHNGQCMPVACVGCGGCCGVGCDFLFVDCHDVTFGIDWDVF